MTGRRPLPPIGAIVYIEGTIYGHRVLAHVDGSAEPTRFGDKYGVRVEPADIRHPLPGEYIVPGARGYVPVEEIRR